ncbi:hypothetical protein AAG570_007905 [Ranatra chinensis]|uniref:Kinesin-like protein KIF2A-like N-terminal domain-containing protein n=1 Tax=Ranatra chinensis TaxID=642074 RepID=A0ABD0YBT4_9HEMI
MAIDLNRSGPTNSKKETADHGKYTFSNKNSCRLIDFTNPLYRSNFCNIDGLLFPVLGRTHPAIVSSVNTVTRSVTVEWFERGETKGKEIEFEAVYALNEHLVTPGNINNQTGETPTKLSRVNSEKMDTSDD